LQFEILSLESHLKKTFLEKKYMMMILGTFVDIRFSETLSTITSEIKAFAHHSLDTLLLIRLKVFALLF
jgi:hypothetical protein